jgi:hypothetical protein
VEDEEVDGEHGQDEAEKDAPGEDLLRVHKDIRGTSGGISGGRAGGAGGFRRTTLSVKEQETTGRGRGGVGFQNNR